MGQQILADLSDVEAAIVTAVTAVIYPSGLAEASVTGRPVRIYRGWPLLGPLGNDLASGVANISVFPMPHATRNTTRWAPLVNTTQSTPTLSVTVRGASATFSGLGGTGQVAGLLVANAPFVCRGRAGDTPALVAAMMAEAVRAERACWLSGNTVSVPGVGSIVARVVADGALLMEWGRQKQGFRISAWCPDPATRDRICRLVGDTFATLGFLTLADGTGGRVRYRSTSSFDDDQDAQQYRRDLVYDIEYGTTFEQAAPSMLFGDLMFSGTPFYG
jgi:hypothetical protein